ncbi:MAG: DUF4920 domain-containing protein [Bacteroidota bacterium]
MKSIYLLFIAALLSCNVTAQDTESDVVRLSEPVLTTDSYEVFGSEFEPVADEVLILSEVVTKLDVYTDKEVTLKGEATKVCKKKGCFFVLTDGDVSARVSFVDYSFFIPTDSQGKTLTFKGIFSVKELTEEQARHFAEDAGEDASSIVGPQKEYAVLASAVAVPKK